MDHLPKFGHAVEAYPRIPYLCIETYDGLPFAEYHIRRGWEVQRLYNGDFSQHRHQETASFLQNWLFFGALNEIFGFQKPFDTRQFILQDGVGKRICTSSLNNNFAVWSARMEELAIESAENCRAQLTRIGVALNTIHQICRGLSVSNDCPLPPDVTLSFRIFGCTIDHALQWHWGLGRGRDWDLNTAATIRMMQLGWCPRDIAMAADTLTEVPMFCASYMSRPIVPGEHDNCSQSICEVNQVDEKTYVTRHRTPHCQCAHFAPNQVEIRKLIDKGEIPVVSLTPKRLSDGTRTFELGVKAGGIMVHWFMAISHVWSDGLGNPHQNSLPLCQLEHLYDLLGDRLWDEWYDMAENPEDFGYDDEGTKKAIDALNAGFKRIVPGLKKIIEPVRNFRGRPLSIWIDTLCVPLDPRYRKIAIARMQDVYAKAVFTAVLDSELRTIRYRACQPEEILLRIGLSGWFRRAWTFQEGVLANTRIRMLFAEGIYKLPLGPMDDTRTVEMGYVFPRFSSVMQSMESRIGKFADRHGVERPPVSKLSKNRIEEQAEYKKSFTLEKYMLQDSKKFFAGMEAAWMLGVGWMKPSDQVQRINATWEALRWRVTSRENDKFICLAIACTNGYKDRAQIFDLLQQPAEQRMKAWIQLQNVVPTGFLFLPGPKYEDPGFRWVPKAVWREPLEDTDFAQHDADTGELIFTKPGFILSPEEKVGNAFQISDTETKLRYSVTLDRQKSLVDLPTNIENGGNIGIILSQRIGQRQPEHEHYKERGALLSSLRKAGRNYYGDYVCGVEVALLEDSRGDLPVIAVMPLGDHHRWVLS